MNSCETNVSPSSRYFIYSPSRAALETFLYPLQCGLFTYLPGYSLTRDSFDSFLLMYLIKGTMEAEWEGERAVVQAGQFLLLDCYQRHSYTSSSGCECLWCHFDGVTARGFYNGVRSRLGNLISLTDPSQASEKLSAIFKTFSRKGLVREPLLSKYLTDILTEFLLFTPQNGRFCDCAEMAERIITYINEHFAEEITTEILAKQAGLSQFHFIRSFKKETGFTPHEYLANTRMATARYLLKNSRLPVKEICYQTGFSGESVFCSAFKKRHGMTPAQYRELGEECEKI